jgi:hypothetical protein
MGEVEARFCHDVAVKKVVPSNVKLLPCCFLGDQMKLEWVLVIWNVHSLLWLFKILCQARRNDYPVGIIVRTNQSFVEEFH